MIDMWPFDGGDQKAKPGRIPTERVRSLYSQGMSEPEIIRVLKSEGYSPVEVDAAMKEALKGAVGSPGVPTHPPVQQSPQPAPPPAQPPHPDSPYHSLAMPDINEPPVPEAPESRSLPPEPAFPPEHENVPEAPLSMPSSLEEPDVVPRREKSEFDEFPIPRLKEKYSREKVKKVKTESKKQAIEELAEAIINEKMLAIKEEILNMSDEFNKVNARINALEQMIKQIKEEKKTDFEKISQKIDTYRNSISEMAGKMEAIEKAMKDTLTPMMQSMRSLVETLKEMRESKG